MSKRLNGLLVALFMTDIVSLGFAVTPVIEVPFESCVIEDISPPNVSTTSWTAPGYGNKAVMFQTISDVDVYIGFVEGISSQTLAVGLLSQGDTLSLTISENQIVYFWGHGTGADVRALVCK